MTEPQEGLGPTGFDPARIAETLCAEQRRALFALPFRSLRSGFSPATLRSLREGARVLFERAPLADYEKEGIAKLWFATPLGHEVRSYLSRCDSDASLAEDAKRLSPEGVAARAEGIAQPEPSK